MNRTLFLPFLRFATPAVFTILLSMCVGANLKAQTLFDFTNNSGGVPNYTDPNLGFDNLKRGSGVGTANLTCTGLSDGYGATGWPTTNTFNTATFNTAGEYFEVKIWPQYDAMNMIDYGLNVTGFTARLRRENYNGTVSDGPIGVRYALRNSGGGGWTSGFNPGNPQQSIVCSSSGTLRPWTGFPAQLVDPGDTLYIRIYGLSSGANETGDFVLKNVVVQGFACAAPPTISPEPDFFAVCAGETEVGFEYSAATGNTYTISYEDDPDALLAGFTSQSGDLDEEGGTIILNIPEEAPSGYYYGTMIVENDCGFTTEYPFTVYVKPLPDVSISVMPLEICAEESVTLTFTDNAASGNFFSILADLNDERGLLPDEVNYTGIPSGAFDTYTEGSDFFFAAGGTVSLSNIRVTDESTLCSTTVDDISIEVHPLPVVTIMGDEEICDGESSELTATGGGTYEWSTTETTASISVDDSGIYSVTVTSDEGCMAFESIGVTVHPLPEPVVTITPEDICPGGSVTLNLDVTNYDETTFNISGSLNGQEVSFSGVTEGDITTWTEGVDFNGDLTFSGITVTETETGCSATLESSVTVNVYDAPIFGFSAASTSDAGGDVSNANGPASITVDFCAGDQLILGPPGSIYTDNGSVGYIGVYNTSGNITYDGAGPLPVGPVYFPIVPSDDGAFFNMVYGGALGYGLSGGTYGTITQVFTPYLDANGNNNYDEGIDCLGDPITLEYHIYGPISITATQNNNFNICSGDPVSYTFTTTSTQNITFDAVISLAANLPGNPEDISVQNGLPISNTLTINSLSPDGINEVILNSAGLFDRARVSLSVTNIRYTDTDVLCGSSVINPNQFTRIYPEPRLNSVEEPILVCHDQVLNIDLSIMGESSFNAATAGYPVRVDWVIEGDNLVEDGLTGSDVLYDNTGVAFEDFSELLQLVDPSGGSQTATITFTPRAAGNTNAFNGDDCYGEPLVVAITVVPPPAPEINGPSCVNVGSSISLAGTPNIESPASLDEETWSSSDELTATVEDGVVTGVAPGTVTIYYTVTDNAGCINTATYEITVLSAIELTVTAIESPVGCGDDIKIVVTASNVCDLTNLNFDVNWDEAAFEYANTATTGLPGLYDLDAEAGVVHFSWTGDPFAFDEEDQPVVLCFYLTATANSGTYSVYTSNEYAENSNESEIGIEGGQVEIEILQLSLTGIDNFYVCPNDGMVSIPYCFLNGLGDHYTISFDDTPPFPDFADGGTLVPDDMGCGQILLTLPLNLIAGQYEAHLQVSSEAGCESVVYDFLVIVDEDAPVVPEPDIVHGDCDDDIPTQEEGVAIIEDLLEELGTNENPEDDPDGCTDWDDLVVAYESSTTISGDGCPGSPLVIEQYYNVVDEAGNVTTVTLTIEVVDDVDPVLSTEFDLDVCWESQEDLIAYIEDNIGQYLSDNCGQAYLDGTPEVILQEGEDCTYDVSITIVDDCGNATSFYPDESPITFTVIIDNDAPVINTELAVLDDCYELLTDNDPETVDAIQDAIAVTLENTTDCSPLSYEVDYVQLTSLCNYRIFVTITDFCGNQSFIDYVVRVDNGGPTILEDGTDELQFSCYQTEEDAIAAASATIEANDNCSQIPELEYSGYFEFTDEENCLGTVYVQVTDGCGNVTTVEFPNIRIDNTAPTVQEGNPDVTCFKTAAEAEAAIEAFVRTLAEDCTPAEDLEIEADYAVVEETPCESGIVYVTITDCAGNYNDIPFEYPVYIDNDNPVFDEIPDFVTDCIEDFFGLGYILEPFEAIQPYVSDFQGCSDVTITLLESEVPELCGEENAGYRVYQATDCAGNTAVYTLTLILEDTEAPQWDEGEGVTSIENGIACDNEGDDLEDLLAFVPAATDNNCFGVIPQLVSETEDIDGCLRTIVRIWSLTDYCGNQAESNFTQTINIIDNTPPTFDPECQFMPPLVLNTSNELFEVDCPQEAIVTNLNNEPLEVGDELTLDDDWLVGGVLIEGLGGCVQDNCSEYEQIIVRVVGVEVDDNVEEFPCARLITLSFEIVDWCGNVSEENFVCQYLIIDDEAPVLLTDGSLDRQVSCDDAAALANALELAPEFSDACDQGELQVNYDETTGETDCSQEYTLTRTWSVTDCAGNTSTTFTQVITVYDDEAPTWVTEEGELDVTITCNDEEELGDAQAMAPVPQDNCQEALSIVKNAGELEPGNCPGAGTITNTWTVTDCANNTSLVFTQVITIIDDQAPTGTANMNIAMCYATVGAAEAAALAATSGSDNCSSVTKTVSTTGTCDALVVVTVTDCAGNTDTVQFHTKIDNTPPTVTAGQINACYPTLVLAENAAKNATIREDNCPGAMGISASTVGVCPATITVTVTDMCGNAASTQYVVCIGTEGSVEIVEEASDMIVGCEDAADLQAWLDNHGGAVAEPEDVQWSHTAVEFGDVDCMSHSKSATVTFTATDGCGYTDETTATFTIKDVTQPSVDPVIPQTNLTCINGTPPAADFNLLTGLGDNCDQSLTLAVAATTSNGGAGCPGNPRTYLRTYTVTDDYCNVSTATHMIVVVDNVPPTFTAPANTTVYIDENCNYNADPAVTGDVTNEMDNCSVNQATYSDFISFGDLTPPVQYMIIRTWSVTDACGNAASTQVQIITVVDPILPTISCPADISVTGGNVEGNTCAWLGSGTSPTYDDNCDPPTLTYTLNGFFVGSSTGSGTVDNRIFLEGTTTVTYTVTDPAGNTASCSFTVNVNCTTISGRIIWEHNGAGVNATTVRLTQGLTLVHSTVTNASGNYTLIPTGVGAHTITPLKNINITNGLTAADVYIVQQHLLGTLITNPYKKVAADVNRTGFITTQDANLINGAIMGDPAALAIFNVSWRFVPTTYSMPATAPNVVPSFPDNITVNVTGPDITGQDFYGIKLGDVNGSANPLALADLSPLVWSVKDEVLQAGKTYELSFDANGFDELVAYQFALQFDPSKMKYLGYESTGATAMNDSQIGLLHIEDGELRVVWTNVAPQSLGLGTPVFKLRFKALESGKRLSEVIDLNHDAVEGLAFNQALTSGEVKLVFTAATDVNNPTTFGKPQLQLFQNKPNPFVDATTIGFVLPEACDAQLRVLDVSGRQLANYNRQYTAGYHEIEFRMANAASYGVLYYELTTPFGKITKKMITGGQ